MRFELQGYQTVQETVVLNAAQVTWLDVLPKPGSFAEEVTVVGAFEPVSTTTQPAVLGDGEPDENYSDPLQNN